MSRRYNEPDESLSGADLAFEKDTLLDFWKWAFCDLCDDDIKGVFAEWVVAKVLASKHLRRISWSNSDLITAGGTRIEVKASAYWQSYKLLDELGKSRSKAYVLQRYPVQDDAKVRFSRLMAGDATGYQPEAQGLRSDLYVFAFQKEKDPERWNAMDLSQWEFFVVEKTDLHYKSIGLASLRKRGPSLSVSELKTTLERLIQDLESAKMKTSKNDDV